MKANLRHFQTKLKIFITKRHALKEILKEILQKEEKWSHTEAWTHRTVIKENEKG